MNINQNKVYIILTALFLVLILLAPVLILFTMQSVTYDKQAPIEGTYNLYNANVAVQQIFSDKNNLHKIGLSIKNPNLENKEQIVLEIVDDNGNIIRKSELNGINIPDGSFVVFQFEPIADSKNKTYSIAFSSPRTNQEKSLGLYMTSKNVTWLGGLKINGEMRDTRLALVRYYQPQQKLDFILGVFASFISNLAYDILFLGSYLVIIFVLISKMISVSKN